MEHQQLTVFSCCHLVATKPRRFLILSFYRTSIRTPVNHTFNTRLQNNVCCVAWNQFSIYFKDRAPLAIVHELASIIINYTLNSNKIVQTIEVRLSLVHTFFPDRAATAKKELKQFVCSTFFFTTFPASLADTGNVRAELLRRKYIVFPGLAQSHPPSWRWFVPSTMFSSGERLLSPYPSWLERYSLNGYLTKVETPYMNIWTAG